jgi:hypothetical protein
MAAELVSKVMGFQHAESDDTDPTASISKRAMVHKDLPSAKKHEQITSST